jgi:hypothetical protein
LVPDNLAQAKVGNLDPANTTATHTGAELALVLFFLVIWPVDGMF